MDCARVFPRARGRGGGVGRVEDNRRRISVLRGEARRRFRHARNEATGQLSHYFSISPARSTRISRLGDTSRPNAEVGPADAEWTAAREREREREGGGGGGGGTSRCCVANAPRCGLLLQFANSRRNGNAISNDTITRALFRDKPGHRPGRAGGRAVGGGDVPQRADECGAVTLHSTLLRNPRQGKGTRVEQMWKR